MRRREITVEDKRLLDSRQLANETGLSEPWIRQLARDGKIPFLRVGHRYWFDRERVVYALSKVPLTAPIATDQEDYSDLEGI
jgi:excisionase family DNA binding protein